MSRFTIYTDGGCSGNPGPGGWAFVVLDDSGRLLVSQSGGEKETTNNRMELSAVINAIRKADALGPAPIILCTDSKYVKDGITSWIQKWKLNGWRTASRQPVKNRGLWEELDGLISQSNVEFRWVKGHAGIEYNELCDQMVRKEMGKFL